MDRRPKDGKGGGGVVGRGEREGGGAIPNVTLAFFPLFLSPQEDVHQPYFLKGKVGPSG